MMIAFLASFVLIFLAEMGDKTQLLSMAFATRYRAREVLAAVFLATIANHAIAVAAGRLLTAVIPVRIISFIAAVSFIAFGLWILRSDKLEFGNKKESRFGPVATVATAFFLAEMGDKTQLATLSLAIEYGNPFCVLLGTAAAMVAADAVGIAAGILMRKHLPDRAIKWISAATFILFGLSGIFRALSGRGG